MGLKQTNKTKTNSKDKNKQTGMIRKKERETNNTPEKW